MLVRFAHEGDCEMFYFSSSYGCLIRPEYIFSVRSVSEEILKLNLEKYQVYKQYCSE